MQSLLFSNLLTVDNLEHQRHVCVECVQVHPNRRGIHSLNDGVVGLDERCVQVVVLRIDLLCEHAAVQRSAHVARPSVKDVRAAVRILILLRLSVHEIRLHVARIVGDDI